MREVFHGDSKTHAEAMINDVRNAFKRNFKNLKWMDKGTRIAAEIKADAISDMIGAVPVPFPLVAESNGRCFFVPGYPDFIQDPKLLDEKYSSLIVRNDSYFTNNLNLNLYGLTKNLEKINEPVNKTTWSE